MDYALENLGPEGFQQMCQALLAATFPRVQCFPIGHSDGGRDALARADGPDTDTHIVFQVKYVRHPLAERRPHAWLMQVVKEEAPKIRDLIQKGATRYVLLTNVPGTGHPDVGSIDTVQRVLSETLDVPSECWWRDDINQRLDSQWSIKWSYPQILNGPDILRYIIELGLKEDAERRALAIRAFVRDQFERDTDVRFKQVELQNNLLDLFVDVPLDIGKAKRQYGLTNKHPILQTSMADPSETEIGAATFLLNPVSQFYFRYVVIEGAPGQGKSTIVQYLCQIHRQRLLGKKLGSLIKKEHQDRPVRLPLKVDCRDLSTWLDRKNPFSADDAADVPAHWHKSLESFLAGQIQHFSGGVAFSVADLQAVLKLSTVLLVFDGLDEVADIARRGEVVDQITKGVNRLQEIAVSVQVVVTSRPAAFTNSPGMPEGAFHYFSLASLNDPLIEEYADKWLRARKVDGKEAAGVRRILGSKLEQPHIHELATSPMQLSILLRLIQTHGESLPDKRTALYDSYVELFFNREAEKSPVVREHRALLIDIHRYLAWVLHVEAQIDGKRGSIASVRLRQLVTEYLTNEEHEIDLADVLFVAVIERVRALVSRVEGNYEFGVQPLREYFAARHLYNTAPYSPAGQPRSGTLPERFDALCRDFYWLNVTRFYAGCYNKGELPSLVDRLEELTKAHGYELLGHPRELALTLLSDWVFSQDPKSMRKVTALLLDGREIKRLLAEWYSSSPSVLPKQCGGAEFVARSFELLNTFPQPDYADGLMELIRLNDFKEARLGQWLRYVSQASGRAKTRWIRYGLTLGVLPSLTSHQVDQLLDCEDEQAERLTLLWRGVPVQIEADSYRFQRFMDIALAASPEGLHTVGDTGPGRLLRVLHPAMYGRAFAGRKPVSLKALRESAFGWNDRELKWHCEVDAGSLGSRCKELVSLAGSLSERSAAEWATDLAPWNELVEKARELFGDRWAFYVLATSSGHVRPTSDEYRDARELLDSDVPLCRRIGFARNQANEASWWQAQLLAATTQDELAFVLLVIIHWAGAETIVGLADLFSRSLDRLEHKAWLRLTDSGPYREFRAVQDERDRELDVNALAASSLSPRALMVLGQRSNAACADQVFRRFLTGYDGDDTAVLRFCERRAMSAILEEPVTWRKWLQVIKRCYRQGVAEWHLRYAFPQMRGTLQQAMAVEMLEEILTDCDSYPIAIIEFAERAYRRRVASKITPVGKVAADDHWFG